MVARSLRWELLGWLLLPLSGVAVFNVWTGYQGAVATAGLITDHTLLASARTIAENLRDYDGVLEAPIPPAALEMFNSDPPDRVIYRVTAPGGELVAGYPDILVPPTSPNGLEPVYFDTEFRNERVRAVALAQPIVAGEAAAGIALVAVGQTLNSHDRLVADLLAKALRDQILLLAAAGLLALFGLRRGLAPLMRLREQILQRGGWFARPLRVDTIQTELKPLVIALNEAFVRVQDQVANQRRFVANAAHQLRNPLALIKTQAGFGLRERAPETKDEALAGINAAADQMSHLSNQLLVLARAEQGSVLLAKDDVDFETIARDRLEGLAEQALRRGVDLGFESDGGPMRLQGHATLLRELVFNLIDNAVRYTPDGGSVTAGLRREGDQIVFTVEDSGPGIPEEDRRRVFERFYRRLETGGEGTGLGLAIVNEIVVAHDGAINLGDRVPPPGLRVVVRLPANAS